MLAWKEAVAVVVVVVVVVVVENVDVAFLRFL